MTLSFLIDEHVKRVYVTELRSHGFDVVVVNEAYEQGTADIEHVVRSQRTGRTILTNDSDFVNLHRAQDHAGIILYNDQDMPVRTFIRGINRIERYLSGKEIRNQLVWLDEWV